MRKSNRKITMLICIHLLIAFFVAHGFYTAWYIAGRHIRNYTETALCDAINQIDFAFNHGTSLMTGMLDNLESLHAENADAELYRENIRNAAAYMNTHYNLYSAILVSVDGESYSYYYGDFGVAEYDSEWNMAGYREATQTPYEVVLSYGYYDSVIGTNCFPMFLSNSDGSVEIGLLINLDRVSQYVESYVSDENLMLVIYSENGVLLAHTADYFTTDINGNDVFFSMVNAPTKTALIEEMDMPVNFGACMSDSHERVRIAGAWDHNKKWFIMVGMEPKNTCRPWVITLILDVVLGVFFAYESFNYIRRVQNYTQKQEELERSKSEFAINVTNRFEEPLATLFKEYEVLDTMLTGEKKREMLRQISVSTTVISLLIHDVQDIDALMKGKVKLKSSPFWTQEIYARLLSYKSEILRPDSPVMLAKEDTIKDYVIGDFEHIVKIGCILLYYTDTHSERASSHFLFGYDTKDRCIRYRIMLSTEKFTDESAERFYRSFTGQKEKAFDPSEEPNIVPTMAARLTELMKGRFTFEKDNAWYTVTCTIPVKEVRHED